MTWYPRDEIFKVLSWENHIFAWSIFMKGLEPTTQDGYLVESGEYD
jgi:hypothetical protein